MDTNIVIVLVVSVIAIIAAVLITAKVTTNRLKKNAEGTIGNAEEKAREIIDEALKTAENKKRESLLEVKEESIRTKNELDKEIKERRAEAQRYERRVQQKEENIDKKADAIEKREASLAAREESLNRMKEEVSRLNEQRVQELERISGLTSEQAKDYLLKIVEDEVKHESAVMIKEMESRAKEEADKKAKEYVVNAIQRCAADHVSETTISVVQLPNDEMKGRIIGREGRNIRTLETLTGVDLIIDDTPEAVILSGFDPIRREVARIALEKLIVDGRIHPARIEEMVEKAQKEVEVMIKEEGEAATLEVGVHGIHPGTGKITRQDEIPYQLWSERIKAFHRSGTAVRAVSCGAGTGCETCQESRDCCMISVRQWITKWKALISSWALSSVGNTKSLRQSSMRWNPTTAM